LILVNECQWNQETDGLQKPSSINDLLAGFKMSKLSAGDVESGTRGILAKGSRDIAFSGVSIDTRTLQNGAVFFAIRGPNQDGHRFISDALAKGAYGIGTDL
jgi:UDP-N-acetylmuramyl tripeptide synthase